MPCSCLFDNFHQFGVGGEILTPCLDFRINGFIPINDGPFFGPSTAFDNYIGGFIATDRVEECAFKGCEAEAGKLFSLPCHFCLFVGVGLYDLTSEFFSSWGA